MRGLWFRVWPRARALARAHAIVASLLRPSTTIIVARRPGRLAGWLVVIIINQAVWVAGWLVVIINQAVCAAGWL